MSKISNTKKLTKPKLPTSNVKTAPPSPRHHTKLLILAIVVLLLFVGVGFNHLKQVHDQKAEFNTARKAIDSILASYKSKHNLTDIQSINSCFHSEQGPFTSGHLHCRIGYQGVINIPADTDAVTIEADMLQTAKNVFGVNDPDGYGLGPVTQEGSKNVVVGVFGEEDVHVGTQFRNQSQSMLCKLSAYRNVDNTFILPTSANQIAVEIKCDQRASQQFYPITEDGN